MPSFNTANRHFEKTEEWAIGEALLAALFFRP
jgi:hypothetical protein